MNSIIVWISQYGIFATCFTILIEYACFPISSEIVLPLSGAIAKLNHFNLFLLIVLSVFCGLLGSLFCYFIGKIFGNKFLCFLTSKCPKTKKAIDTSYDYYHTYGNKAVLIARLIPLCRTYISFISGILNQSISTFILYSSIGILIWNTVLLSLGYFLGQNYTKVAVLYKDYKNIILIALIIIFISFLINKLLLFKKKSD